MLKKTYYYSLFICLVTCVVISSCSTHENTNETVVENRIFVDYHYALDSIIKTKEGIISGIELGQSVKLIPAREINQAIEKASDHITFEQTIDKISKYTITYSFENDSITEMEVLITSQNSEEGEKILADLKSYYTKKYTAPIMDKGYFVFTCFDSKKRNFTITLTDNSGASNSVIDMFVYREK